MRSNIFLPPGVFTAALTPLHEDLSIDVPHLVEHCRWLLENGSDGLALLGTTGEANSFSFQERMDLLNTLASEDLPMEKIMVGTGTCTLPETIELTRSAVEKGAGGILLLPPFYYNNPTDDGLMAYMDRLIRSVNHERLRIYLYHIPQLTGVPYGIPLVKRLTAAFPEIVVGMKDSSGDFENMRTLLEEIPGFQLFAGTEKYLLDILKIGGLGCISATANATSPMAGKVYAAWKNQNFTLAEQSQAELTEARKAFEGFVFVAALKSYFAAWKEDDSWGNVRPPNGLLTAEQMQVLQERLTSLPVHPQSLVS